MGIRGLKTFLEREKQTRPINIGDEVIKWKRANPGRTPIIVIDFLSLTNGVVKKDEDIICGGRHKIALNRWKELLNALKGTGSELVFFSDLTIQEGKIDEWLLRRDEEFEVYTEVYDLISSGIPLSEVVANQTNRKALTSTFYGMAIIAQNYGQFHYSIRHECDLEIAQYAKRNGALAVISNDTDFLIFDGEWRFWSSQDIKIIHSNRLKTIEFNRNGIANICSLATYQLPLFSTLLANDFTHIYYNQLARFYCTMGPMKYRIKNVARYVRRVGHVNLNDSDITQIIQHVFGYIDDDLQRVFRQSLNAYNTDFPAIHIDDPLEKKLLLTKMYRPYMSNLSSINGFTLPYYDMRGSATNTISFSMMLIHWIQRRKGILRQTSKESQTFLVLAKKEINQHFMAHSEEPIYPEFALPTLNQLYLDDESNIIETKWNIFGWIMSFSDDVISLIKNVPKDFLLIICILTPLVKNGLISIEEADGILYTESMVYANVAANVEYPAVLVPKYVRAAHLYNITFAHVRNNFAIAGLLSHVQECLQFDGVYFQKLMENVTKMSSAEREILFTPIKKYRIYTYI
ncbi:uncharacterized protein LOC116342439 [Contarinia nasturtii]|uniref:uncharacterized protein LOC116342439 n=1 Tax=Contarinia nasturtii TaxID=265458 RepID=UPI0012D4B181|nr:uncharacterized protein LOC116342439 [Contarinia nasturtii]